MERQFVTLDTKGPLASPGEQTAINQPSILAVTQGLTHREDVLVWANIFASMEHCPIHRLCVLPKEEQLHHLFPHRPWPWNNESISHPESARRLWLHGGQLKHSTITLARKIKTSLIVVPQDDLKSAAALISLVHRTKLPVLIARQTQASMEIKKIIIATDLFDEQPHPLLRHIVDNFSATSKITLVYNFEEQPLYYQYTADGSPAAYWPLSPGHLDEQRERLRQMASNLGPNIHWLLTQEDSPIEAISTITTDMQPDLLVIGHHFHNWLNYLLRMTTSAKIVEQVKSNVLVLPLAQ